MFASQFWRFLAIFGVFHTLWIKLENFFFKECEIQQVCQIRKKNKSMTAKKKSKWEKKDGERERNSIFKYSW